MKRFLDYRTGLMRGIYATDADAKVIGITVGEVRALNKAIRAARAREAKLLDFVLSASAENPAHIGSYRNKAVALLEELKLPPREEGTFYQIRAHALKAAEELLP